MAKKESTFGNMVLTLFIVTFVSSTALGYVYEVTKGPKAKAELEKKIKAISEVVPDFDNSPIEEKVERCAGEQCVMFYPAKKDGQLVGTAVEVTTNKGFAGNITLMVGFLPDGVIFDTAVVEHKETPGLGDKIDKKKSGFAEQFKNKDPQNFRLSVKKDGGDVDAITAATISSRGFCDAVKKAYDSYRKEFKD